MFKLSLININRYRQKQKIMILHHYYDSQDFSESQQQQSEQESIIRLKSIKEVFNEQSSYANTEHHVPMSMLLSNKIKGMILCGILFKERQRKIGNVKACFYKWYAKANGNQRCEEAINRFMIYGKISKEKCFYKLKIMAKRWEIQGLSFNIDQKFQDVDSLNTQKNTEIKPKSSHNRQKAVVQLNKLRRVSKTEHLNAKNPEPQYQKQNPIPKKQKQLKNSQSIKSFLKNQQHNAHKYDQPQQLLSDQSSADNIKLQKQKYQSSINNILLQSSSLGSFTSVDFNQQNYDSCDQNQRQGYSNNNNNSNNIRNSNNSQNSKNSRHINNSNSNNIRQNFRSSIKIDQAQKIQKQKESISNIDPTSGNLRIQLVTCTNIFQNSLNQQNNHNITLKMTATIDICRLCQKFRNKVLHLGFRKFIQITAFQENYQEQLLKARRNLELVEENFMVQCQIDAITQNYQEQNEHLENIDKNLQILRQKFLFSKTSSIVRILKKLTYPILTNFLVNLKTDENTTNPPLQPQQYLSTKIKNNIYEVQQLQAVGVSSTSLSHKTYSNNFIRELEDQNQSQSQSRKSINRGQYQDRHFGCQINNNNNMYKFGDQKSIGEQEQHQ